MKQAVIMLATLGVLALGTAPSGNASADINSPFATVQASFSTASLGWAVSKWSPLGGLVVGAAVTRRTFLTGWRIGTQVGLAAGIADAVVGGALGGF